MIEAAAFVENARTRGFEWYAGVPCSFLTPFINYVISDPTLNYISSSNEGDAVATASGVVLGGGRAIVMMQNSGLGNAVSPLTSLNQIFRIPVLLICTHRGAPGVADEPQHALMGQITGQLFDTLRIPWQTFPDSVEHVDSVLDAADQYLREERRPYALIMQKGSVAPYALRETLNTATTAQSIAKLHDYQCPPADRPSRRAVLERIQQRTTNTGALLLATTGYTGRELFALGDHANQLYMVGSMGCVSSLGLGVSLLQPQLETVIIDGDGAALMRMGNLATVGRYGGSNLTHIVLDNEVYDSTGGQTTVSASVDFASIAANCGYATVVNGDDTALIDAVVGDTGLPGPRLLHIKTRPGTIDNLARPNIAPADLAARFMRYLQ